tara:strand:+ start:102 stop:272 length:171 start_codon:yes stop_codon:yes gene_type:complete
MQICLGMMQLPPSVFWEMSPNEMYQAIKGFQKFNSVSDDEPLNRTELDRLMELYPD